MQECITYAGMQISMFACKNEKNIFDSKTPWSAPLPQKKDPLVSTGDSSCYTASSIELWLSHVAFLMRIIYPNIVFWWITPPAYINHAINRLQQPSRIRFKFEHLDEFAAIQKRNTFRSGLSDAVPLRAMAVRQRYASRYSRAVCQRLPESMSIDALRRTWCNWRGIYG